MNYPYRVTIKAAQDQKIVNLYARGKVEAKQLAIQYVKDQLDIALSKQKVVSIERMVVNDSSYLAVQPTFWEEKEWYVDLATLTVTARDEHEAYAKGLQQLEEEGVEIVGVVPVDEV